MKFTAGKIYGSFLRDFLSCLTLAVTGSFLGPILIAKNKTLYGDVIVHATLFGVAIAYLFLGNALWIVVTAAIVSSFTILLLSHFVSNAAFISR